MGSVLLPQVVYLRRFWPAAPISICIGLICVSVTLGYFVYPETKARPQLDSAKDRLPLLLSSESEEEDDAL